MSKKLYMTNADYVAIAISPALIMALVGSLVYFLIEVMYVGEYQARLNYAFALFVFAAVLIARIYEAFPLLCPMCGGQMRIIAFITHSAEIRHILNHIGVESAPPHITPARGPPLWEGCDAPVDDGAQGEPDWDLAAQPDEVDQRVNW